MVKILVLLYVLFFHIFPPLPPSLSLVSFLFINLSLQNWDEIEHYSFMPFYHLLIML